MTSYFDEKQMIDIEKMSTEVKMEYLRYKRPWSASMEDHNFMPLYSAICKYKPPISENIKNHKFGQNTETFCLSPELGAALLNAVNEGRLTLPQIDDIKLPYDEVVFEMTWHKGDSNKIRSCCHIKRNHKKKRIELFPFVECEDHIWSVPMILILESVKSPDKEYFKMKYPNGNEMTNIFASLEWDDWVTGTPQGEATLLSFSSMPENIEQICGREIIEEFFMIGIAHCFSSIKSGVSYDSRATKVFKKKDALKSKSKTLQSMRYTKVCVNESESFDNGILIKKSVSNAHWVRGHFKQRNTGLYWWNPHIRGTGEVLRRDAYLARKNDGEISMSKNTEYADSQYALMQ